jgi:PAS domain S-box-containing protein
VDWGEALFEALVDTSEDGVFCCDREGVIARWNHSAERIFGRPRDEVVGQRPETLFSPHLRSEFEDVFHVVQAGDRVRQFETEILRKDGLPIPIALSMRAVLDDDSGRPVASVAIARDITEQRVAQATLAEIEARVRDSEALAHVGSWLWDVRTDVVQWSHEFHDIHGIEPTDFDGTLAAHVARIDAEDRDRVRQALLDAVDDIRAFEDEYRVVRPDGDVRIVHARAQPTIGSDGECVGLRGIGQDVTVRR